MGQEVDAAVAAVRRGGVVVTPTDTVYGLACLPEAGPIERIFALKGRPADRTLQVLLPGVEWVERVAVSDERARALARAFLPGPLTLVLPASPGAPAAVVRDGTIGVRVPAYPLALELVAATGPVAATSANLSGRPTPADVATIREVFGSSVDAYVDGGTLDGPASTVVDLTGSAAVVLREGGVSMDELASVLGGPIGAG